MEGRLKEIGVDGISVSHVKGYSEYVNFLSRDWTVTHGRIEIFTNADRANEIVDAIMGLRSTPKKGYRTPAAMGTPSAL